MPKLIYCLKPSPKGGYSFFALFELVLVRSRRRQVTTTCYCSVNFDLGALKSINTEVVSLRKQQLTTQSVLMGYIVSVFLSPNDFLALMLLVNVWTWSIFSIACLLQKNNFVPSKCPEILKCLYFRSDNM